MRFTGYGPKDDPSADIGDAQFLRFATRGQGVDLPEGVLRYAGNLRLGDKRIKPRKGSKALATDLALTNPPIVLDVNLGVDLALSSLTRIGGTATATTVLNHGYATGDFVAIEHADQAGYNGDFTITVTGLNTFTFAVAGAPATPGTGPVTANKGLRIFADYADVVRGSFAFTSDENVDAFVLALSDRAFVCRAGVASVRVDYPVNEYCNGAVSFEQFEGKVYLFRGSPSMVPIAVTSITRAGAIATMTTTPPHGRATNDWLYVTGAAQNGYNGTVQVTVTGANTLTYAVDGGTVTPATGVISARTCQPVLSWDRNTANDFVVASSGPHATALTFIKMPPAEWAHEFNRRLWLPYARDQILGTDYSDANTIDTNSSQTRIRPGGNDWLVGALGFQKVGLLIAYRKSMHLLTLTIADLTIATGAKIEGAFGCVARRTLVNCAGQILFLSDGGVARLTITSELNLISAALPLSDDIQDLFDGVNWAAAGSAVAAYYDNRYFIALPMNGSLTNNTIFVFSFLNGGGWESVDTYPGAFDIQALHTADYLGRQRLHVVTTFGALYLLEELEVDEFGANAAITSHVIRGVARTRYLTHGTSDVKRFLRAMVELNLDAGEAIEISASLRNPDQTAEILSVTATADDDTTRRPRIARRGVSCSLEIETTAGRPEMKSYTIEANVAERSNKPR